MAIESEHRLFHRDGEIPKVEERLNVYKENALPLAMAAIQNSIEELGTTVADFKLTHLITVTCTGLYAPGIDTELISNSDFRGIFSGPALILLDVMPPSML